MLAFKEYLNIRQNVTYDFEKENKLPFFVLTSFYRQSTFSVIHTKFKCFIVKPSFSVIHTKFKCFIVKPSFSVIHTKFKCFIVKPSFSVIHTKFKCFIVKPSFTRGVAAGGGGGGGSCVRTHPLKFESCLFSKIKFIENYTSFFHNSIKTIICRIFKGRQSDL